MIFKQVHNNQQIMLLQCISGSKAYGLDTPQSDTDIRGIFVVPKREFYGLHYTEQVANTTNDIVYYELGRVIELLLNNNPNILELLNIPPDKVLYRHPIIDMICPEMFLSKLCQHTFAGYAQAQIKKATGLNKKIFKPIDEKRKNPIDFCYIIEAYSSIPLNIWLQQKGYKQEHCGLVKIPHARDIYAIFHQSQLKEPLRGICSENDGNELRLSSIPENLEPLALMNYNKEGYSSYCKDYSQYWDWVKNRNEVRYQNTIKQGKNYDAKNMMHTFRLLNMAEEIVVEKRINVFRRDRDFLLKIRNGVFLYNDLQDMANEKMLRIKTLFTESDLPETPDKNAVNNLLISMREKLYEQ